MEQWRQILNSSSVSDEVSILDADVTGIKGSNTAPDGVFYTEFSEEEAIAYHKIFSNFIELYGINSRIAVSGLEDDLNMQNAAINDNFCPVELILFFSRYVNGIIENERKSKDSESIVFKKLKIIVGKLLNDDATKIAQYILGGWEWKMQLSIFVEAIGAAVPELVDVAMEYYSQIASMCADDDKSLLRSYINMLLSTQDESFAVYFSDVVTHEVFMNDNEVIDYFCKCISRDPYWKNEDISRQIIEEIEGRMISPILRKRITDLKRQLLKNETRTEATIHDMLNSRNIDYETKVEWVNKLHFTGACATDVYEWEMTRDPDISMLINYKAMENMDTIMPDEIKGRAYIALATHAKRHKDEVIDFLLKQKEKAPDFRLPIDIALFDLRVISSEELFTSLFTESYQEFYGKTLGKYFRYNKVAISNDFMSFLKRYLNNSLDESALDKALMILYQVLEPFNRRDGMIADESFGIADNVMKVLLNLNGDYKYSNTYNSFMDILDLISKESPSNKSDVLKILYKFKDIVSKKSNMPSIGFRIDTDIKKLDVIVAPTGN